MVGIDIWETNVETDEVKSYSFLGLAPLSDQWIYSNKVTVRNYDDTRNPIRICPILDWIECIDPNEFIKLPSQFYSIYNKYRKKYPSDFKNIIELRLD